MSKTDLLNIEMEWKDSTTLGNQLFPKSKQKALLTYRIAFAKAEKLMTSLKNCIDYKIPIVHVYLISCNNLAETYCLMKKWTEADKMYRPAIYYVVYLLQEQSHTLKGKNLSQLLQKQVLLYQEFTKRADTIIQFKDVLEQVRTRI